MCLIKKKIFVIVVYFCQSDSFTKIRFNNVMATFTVSDLWRELNISNVYFSLLYPNLYCAQVRACPHTCGCGNFYANGCGTFFRKNCGCSCVCGCKKWHAGTCTTHVFENTIKETLKMTKPLLIFSARTRVIDKEIVIAVQRLRECCQLR